jgi:hypothetical protein
MEAVVLVFALMAQVVVVVALFLAQLSQ